MYDALRKEKKTAKIVKNGNGQTTVSLEPDESTYVVNMTPYNEVGVIADVKSTLDTCVFRC